MTLPCPGRPKSLAGATIWTCNDGANQKWTSTGTDSGYVFKAANGMCLDVAAAGTTNGTRVQTWTCNGTDAQAWMLR